MHILGVKTNIPFILWLYTNDKFLNFDYSLKFFE